MAEVAHKDQQAATVVAATTLMNNPHDDGTRSDSEASSTLSEVSSASSSSTDSSSSDSDDDDDNDDDDDDDDKDELDEAVKPLIAAAGARAQLAPGKATSRIEHGSTGINTKGSKTKATTPGLVETEVSSSLLYY